MKNLLKNFQKLREIEPTLEWSMKTKSFLISRIDHEESGSFLEGLQIFVLRLERKLIPSPVKIIAALLVLCLGTGTTLAAKAAIPGSPLYSVKTQIEKVELVLVTNPKSEAAVHLKHAKNRIFEVEQLTKQEKTVAEQYMNNVVKNLQKDISAAQSSLEIAENEETNVGAVVAVAVQLNQGAVEATQILNQTVSAISSEETKQTVNEVVETTETVQDNTTTLIVDKKVNGLVSDEVVTTEQVKEIVVTNINTIENKLKSVEEKVNQIKSTEVTEAIKQQEQQMDQSSLNLKQEEVTEVLKKPEEAKQALEEAKKLVEETALTQALEKTKESKEITKETEKVLNKIDKVIQETGSQSQGSGLKIDNKLPAGQTYSTTTTSTTALEVTPVIELGGINNEEEVNPGLKEDEEPVVVTTPLITN